MTLEDLLIMWGEDSKINKSKLDDESLNTALLHSKYLEVYSGLKKNIQKRQQRLRKLELEKKQWLKGTMTREEEDSRGWDHDPWKGQIKPLKGEMEEYIKTDDDVMIKREELNDREAMLEVVVEILDQLKWRHSHVRNAIEFMKFTSGY